MQQPIPDVHTAILEECFFKLLDRGVKAVETPLFTRKRGEEALAEVIAEQLKLPLTEAERLLDIAQAEVSL